MMINENEKRIILSLCVWNACNRVDKYEVTDNIIHSIYYEGMLDIAKKNMDNSGIQINSSLLNSLTKKTKSSYDFITENMNEFLEKIKSYNYVNLKGPVLNYYTYRKVDSYRLMDDCDILLLESDAKELYEFIKLNISEAHLSDNEDLIKYYLHYLQHLPGIQYKDFDYEIHHRLNQRNEPFPINSLHMFDSTTRIGNFVYPTFEMFFISMCQHIFRHEYLEATFKWRSICDVINTILLCPLDWDKIVKLTENVASKFIIYYVLKRAETVYEFITQSFLLKAEVIELFSSEHDKELDNIVFKTYHSSSNGFYSIGTWNQGYLNRLFKGAINDLNRYDPISVDFNYQFVRKVQYDNNIRQCKEIGLDFESFMKLVVPEEAT